jgi:hypothetical protein
MRRTADHAAGLPPQAAGHLEGAPDCKNRARKPGSGRENVASRSLRRLLQTSVHNGPRSASRRERPSVHETRPRPPAESQLSRRTAGASQPHGQRRQRNDPLQEQSSITSAWAGHSRGPQSSCWLPITISGLATRRDASSESCGSIQAGTIRHEGDAEGIHYAPRHPSTMASRHHACVGGATRLGCPIPEM